MPRSQDRAAGLIARLFSASMVLRVLFGNDTKFMHAMQQRGARQSEPDGGAATAAHNPIHLPQHFQNMSALRVGKRQAGGGFLRLRRALRSLQGRAQHWPGRQDHGAFDEVLKFADVPRPIVVFAEPPSRCPGMMWICLFMRSANLCTKCHTRSGISSTRSRKRRKGDGKNMQPVKQIRPKPAFLDHRRKIAVGGGHNANVHPNGARAAEPLEFLLLQHAQQLGLQFQRHVADFVQKQRSLMRQLKASDGRVQGAGVGSALMAEQFAFKQPARNGGAVQRHKWFVPARALVVDSSGNEFFAGSGLALDQHSGVGGSHHAGRRSGPAACPGWSRSVRFQVVEGSRRGSGIVLAKVAMIQCLLLMRNTWRVQLR